MPVVLVGTQVSGKDNFMAVGWCARVNGNPPMIACGIANNHYTPEGMTSAKTFSVNIPSSDLLEKTDYCGIVSGGTEDKSKVFTSYYGKLKTAPMAEECPVNIECKLFKSVDCGSHLLYIGEVEEIHVAKACTVDGKPDVTKIDSIVYAQATYWKVGKEIDKAFSAGKNYSKK